MIPAVRARWRPSPLDGSPPPLSPATRAFHATFPPPRPPIRLRPRSHHCRRRGSNTVPRALQLPTLIRRDVRSLRSNLPLQAQNSMSRLAFLCGSAQRVIVMKLLYYDMTPEDYEPPYFRCCSTEEGYSEWTKNP